MRLVRFPALLLLAAALLSSLPGWAALPGLTIGDSGRYLETTTGKPFYMVGRQINFTWGQFWRLLERHQTAQVDAYLKALSDKGINTLRIFAEDLDPNHTNLFESDITTGALNGDVLNFLRTILDIGDKYGIYFIVSPWETYYMGDDPSRPNHRWTSNQYYTKGVISNPGEFYRTDNPNGLNDYQKRRLTSLLNDVVQGRGNVVLELINEIDGEWQFPYITPDQPGHPGRATWFPQVVQPWLEMMRDHVRGLGYSGPLGFSTSVEFPAFPEERDFLFRLEGFDLFFYHPYIVQRDACVNWPCGQLAAWPEFAPYCTTEVKCTGDPGVCDQPQGGCVGEHKTIQPARDFRNAVRFAYANGTRPYIDSEDGPLFHSSYDSRFSLADDIVTFRNQQWANVASGSASSGIRHPQNVLAYGTYDSLLPTQMDDIQGTIAHFFSTGQLVDLVGFEADSLEDAISVSVAGDSIVRMGVKDREGLSAMAYLLVDRKKLPTGVVGPVSIGVGGLLGDRFYTVEAWSPDGYHTTPDYSLRVKTDAAGTLSFDHDLDDAEAFKFTLTQPERSAGAALTDRLAIGATIQTEELGPVTATWKEGGRTRTARGDVVVWGHFYAPPSQISWGDANNPDAFAKIWFDASGRIDVNFFHVSVPDITVNSAFDQGQGWTRSGNLTLNGRYIRQEYHDSPPSITPTSGTGSRSSGGYQVTPELRISATFYPGAADAFPAAWREGGRATTARGDQVIWGFFYADPSDRDWGSPENPDVFVKIWYDVSGRVDVNYFHVSVPDIQVDSTFNGSSSSGTVTLDGRYLRHEFHL